MKYTLYCHGPNRAPIEMLKSDSCFECIIHVQDQYGRHHWITWHFRPEGLLRSSIEHGGIHYSIEENK